MAEVFHRATSIRPEKTRFQLDPVPEGHKPGWKVEMNGAPVADPVHSLKLTNEGMGLTVEYGHRGYDRPVLKEPGGGGSVTIPYYLYEGRLYVGVVAENRDLMGGVVWNVPRGFMDPGSTHFATAKTEYQEETGHSVPDARVVSLTGDPTNTNSAFFDTSGEDEGVKFYAVKLLDEELRRIDTPDNRPQFEFNPDVLEPKSKTAEKIMKTTVIPFEDAMHLADGFTVAGVGRLFLQLVLSGDIDPTVYAPSSKTGNSQ